MIAAANRRGVGLLVVAAAALVSAAAAPGCKRKPTPLAGQTGGEGYGDQYVSALAAANSFCRAWQQGDVKAGTALLSRRIKRKYTDQRIRDAIVGLDNPHHAAFEIFGGEPGPEGRIVFQVRLFYKYLGQAQDRIEAPVERIAMVRDGSGNWLVDEFPLLGTSPD